MPSSDLLRHQACKCYTGIYSSKSTHTPKLNHKQNKNTFNTCGTFPRPETSCALRWGNQGCTPRDGEGQVLSSRQWSGDRVGECGLLSGNLWKRVYTGLSTRFQCLWLWVTQEASADPSVFPATSPSHFKESGDPVSLLGFCNFVSFMRRNGLFLECK
uniref:Uncharacterized protein n=1 Tax=Mus musculus TaxID=10090 RepID=Q9D5M4_MOUSE|nr:unnamed protein product [Mus musculus]